MRLAARRPTPTRRLPTPLAALLACLLGATAARAQHGTVTGTVVDQDGNPQGFVDVFLEGETSTYSESQLTEENGTFRFSPVPVNLYRLYAYAEGFTSEKYTGVHVTANQTLRFTVKLKVAATETEFVEVQAGRLFVVDTKKTETSMNLNEKFIGSLPLQNKRIQDIVALFPGVVRGGGSDSTDISVGGGTSGQIGYRLNGASINDPVDGGALFDVPTAAIQDFKFIRSGFQAKYGEQSSAIAEIITKSGTNTIQTSYSVDFRDTDYGSQSIPGIDDSNQDIDEFLRGEGTLIEDDIAQGFRLMGIDPNSTTEDDNNPIPRHRVRHTISAGGPIIRDKLFFHTTLEALADDEGGAFAGGRNQTDQILNATKFNWTISERNQLDVTFNLDVTDTTGFAGFRAPPSVNVESSNGAWLLVLDDTHKFPSTSSFLNVKFRIQRAYATTRPEDVRAGPASNFEIPLPPGGFISYFVGGAGGDSDQTLTSPRVDASWGRPLRDGKHQFEIGGAFEYTTFRLYNASAPTISDFRVSNDVVPIGGQPPFVGRETTFGDPVDTKDSSWAANAYVQDTWLVTDNFTLDVGLRVDYQSFVGEAYFAPRVGFSLDPIGDGKTRLYGNWGINYDNIFANALQWTAQPDQFVSDLRFAGAFASERGFGQTPTTTAYREAQGEPINTPDPDAVSFLVPDLHDTFVLDENLSAPTTRVWAIGLERRLPGDMRMQFSYEERKRTHQIGTTAITRRTSRFPGEFTLRDRVQRTTGEGRFRQWAAEIQKPFLDDRWSMSLSYVQGKNTGPIARDPTPLDPSDVISGNGLQGNDRPHVIKLQGNARLSLGGKGKAEGEERKGGAHDINVSTDFTWQSGTPVTPIVYDRFGNVNRPFGDNTLRLPSQRYWNFSVRYPFETSDGKLKMQATVNVFNFLNEYNVISALGRFELPPGQTDPSAYPPLRPDIVPTGIDVSRSLELGFTVSF
jgi:hypothetical protein